MAACWQGRDGKADKKAERGLGKRQLPRGQRLGPAASCVSRQPGAGEARGAGPSSATSAACPHHPRSPGPQPPHRGSGPHCRKVPGASPAHRETQMPSAWVRVRPRKAVTCLRSPSQCRCSRVFTEKSLRTKRKKPPVRDRGDPGGPNDDDSASRGHPSGPLRYGRVPGLWPVDAYRPPTVCVLCVWTDLESKL